MCIQLTDRITPFHLLSHTERVERVEYIRHNKYVAKPASKARAVRETKKKAKAVGSKVTNLLKGLSREEQLALLKELDDGN